MSGSPAPERTKAPVSGSRTATEPSVEMSITFDHVTPWSAERITDWWNWFGGDRLLVVEARPEGKGGHVAGERDRLAPGVAPVGRLADEHRRHGHVGARRTADLVDVAVRG